MTTLLEPKQNKIMRGHISSTIQTSIPTTKANNQNGLLMGVYCMIRSTGYGRRIYIGASRNLWTRWQQHKCATRLWNKNYSIGMGYRDNKQMKKRCQRLGFVLDIVKAVRETIYSDFHAIIQPARQGDPASILADTSNAESDLNWKHDVSISEMLSEGWKIWLENEK
jgi:hypothetical protein